MQQQIKILYKNSPTGRIFRVRTNPLAILLILFALISLLLFVTTVIDFLWDHYYPYEGKVLKIETHWYDYISSEFMSWEHLLIETPDGGTIDKLVGMEIRSLNRIKQGDYVVKKKGFRNPVKSRDKKTTQEILDEWNSLKNEETEE